jgi:hypothetical protein
MNGLVKIAAALAIVIGSFGAAGAAWANQQLNGQQAVQFSHLEAEPEEHRRCRGNLEAERHLHVDSARGQPNFRDLFGEQQRPSLLEGTERR